MTIRQQGRRAVSIRSNRSTRRNFQPTSGLGIESAPSSRIAINLGRIDLLQCHVLRTRNVHVIVVSQVLTSGFGDALGANRVESSISSDESTHCNDKSTSGMTIRQQGRRVVSIRSNRSTRRNFQPTSGLGIESAQSS